MTSKIYPAKNAPCNLTVRLLQNDDIEKVRAIYAQYIDTNITFEYTLPSFQDFCARVSEVQKTYPYLVAQKDGVVVAYAYAHSFKERAAYQWDAELSLYVDKNFCGAGIGTRLYRTLIDVLALQGVHTVYGVVTNPNKKSMALHKKLGFKKIATFCNTGFKNGTWLDVCYFEKRINPIFGAPKPIVQIDALDKSALNAILSRHTLSC